MSTHAQQKEQLRQWIARANGQIEAQQIKDDTPLIGERILRSIQVMDLLLFLEQLRGSPVPIGKVTPSAFGTINALVHHFLQQPYQILRDTT